LPASAPCNTFLHDLQPESWPFDGVKTLAAQYVSRFLPAIDLLLNTDRVDLPRCSERPGPDPGPNRRCGPLSETTAAQVQALPLEQLEALADALLDFQGPANLTSWLAADGQLLSCRLSTRRQTEPAVTWSQS